MDFTQGTIDKPTVGPTFSRQLDECRSAGGRVNDSLEVRGFGVSKRRVEASHRCDTKRGTCGGKRCRRVDGFIEEFDGRGSSVGSDIRSLKDTSGFPDLLVIAKLFVCDTQDEENSANIASGILGLRKISTIE